MRGAKGEMGPQSVTKDYWPYRGKSRDVIADETTSAICGHCFGALYFKDGNFGIPANKCYVC